MVDKNLLGVWWGKVKFRIFTPAVQIFIGKDESRERGTRRPDHVLEGVRLLWERRMSGHV